MGQADRTLTLLQHLSKNAGDPHLIVDLLAPGRVAVMLGADLATEPQAQLVFSFTVNLLARLYPLVQSLEVVVPPAVPVTAGLPRWVAATMAEHCRRLLLAVNPPARWRLVETPQAAADCALIVGAGSLLAPVTVFGGSAGWVATVSPLGPVLTGPPLNPVGAYAAACLGVAEVSKWLLDRHRGRFDGVPIVPLDTTLTFSAFTHRTGSSHPNPAIPDIVDLQRLTLVGLGAGGGALAFTLASLGGIRGVLHLVEPDEILEHNLNRYVWADAADAVAQRAKAKVAADLFRAHQGLSVLPHCMPYHRAATSFVQEDYRYVVAAVHSREARRELQYETPLVLWDAAATDQGEFFVWRMILGTTECMHCKHPSGEADPEQGKAAQLAQLLGLDVPTWLGKVRNNDPFQESEIEYIANRAAGAGISIDVPAPGQRYDDWERTQCGRLQLPELDEEIPFPCAPVMAGVLLAGEIIKEHYFRTAVLDSYYWNTLLGRFMVRNQPYRRCPRPECAFCRDGAYLNQYRRRWSQS